MDDQPHSPPGEELRQSLSEYHIRNLRDSAQVLWRGSTRGPYAAIPLLFGVMALFWLGDTLVWYAVERPASFWGLLLFEVPAQVLAYRILILALLGVIGWLLMRVRLASDLEAALRRSSRWFSTTLKSTGTAMIATDRLGNISFMNPAAEKLSGWRLEHAVGQPVEHVCPIADDPAPGAERYPLVRVVKEGEQITLSNQAVLHSALGTYPPVAGVATPIRDEQNEIIGAVLVLYDLTAYRLVEEAQLRLAAAVEQSPDAVLITDLGGRVIYLNPSLTRISGLASSDLVGQPVQTLVSRTTLREDPTAIAAALKANGQWRGRLSFPGADGGPRELEGVAAVITNLRGQPMNYVGIMRDVSRETELQAQLIRAQKLEAVGVLAGSVAHDFNNLLTIILNYASLLVQASPGRPDEEEMAKEILAAAERGCALTRQLLTFSRKHVVQPQVLPLNEVVTGLSKMLRRLLPESIEFQTELAPDAGNLVADPGQLEQVLMNLVVNARDAMVAGGRLTVATTTADRAPPGEPAPVARGPYVVLRVLDNGCGMDAATIARIFEPFFTTKGVGKGTGLGLSTVASIVNQLGGCVRVHSQVGVGSEFAVYLPRTASGLTTSIARTRAQSPTAHGGETVLLVEDDASIRLLTRMLLRQRGYHVLDAANGVVGLRVAAEHPEPIHLLLTDLVMPQMDGRELARHLQGLRPRLAVLFMTGYSETGGPEGEASGLPPEAVLRKPFTTDELLRRVRTAIDGGAAAALAPPTA